MGKFKIGDRVRAGKNNGWVADGTLGTVAENNNVPYVDWDTGHTYAVDEKKLEAAFTLTPGKLYRAASGAVTGRVAKGDPGFEAVVDGKVRIFDAAGGAVHGGDDIVEEWVPKVGERVRFAQNNPNGGSHYGAAGEVVEVASAVEKNPHYGDQVYIIHPAHDWKPAAPVSVLEPLPVAAPAQPAAPVAAQVDAIAEEYGPAPKEPDTTLHIKFTSDFSELDAAILVRKKKLKKLIKLARKAGIEMREAEPEADEEVAVGDYVTLVEPARVTGFDKQNAMVVFSGGGSFAIPIKEIRAA